MNIPVLLISFLILSHVYAASDKLYGEDTQRALETTSLGGSFQLAPLSSRRSKELLRILERKRNAREAAGVSTSAAGAGSDSPSITIGTLTLSNSTDTFGTPTFSSGSTADTNPMLSTPPSAITEKPAIIRISSEGPWYEHYEIPFLPKQRIPYATRPVEDHSTAEAKAVSSMRWFKPDSISHKLANIYLNPETPIIHDESLEAYLARMERENKPATLIIGCGHLEEQVPDGSMHWHKDCWVININPTHLIREGGANVRKTHFELVHPNEEIDITMALPRKYYNKFDNVILERSYEETVNKETTWENVLLALKINGILWMEDGSGSDLASHGYLYGMGYNDLFKDGKLIKYAMENFKPGSSIVALKDDQLGNLSAPHQEEIATIQYGLLHYEHAYSTPATRYIGNVNKFLTNLYCTDVGNMYIASPFAAGRRGNFIIARKTDMTQQLLDGFLAAQLHDSEGQA